MAGGTIRIRVTISGAREIIRELNKLGPHAQRALRARSRDIARRMATRIRAAADADSAQSARAGRSVKVLSDRLPVVQAGGTKRASAVLFGSEFGANARFGWYARPRYAESGGRQYRPHRGKSSYWFFKTAERMQPEVARAWRAAADDIIRQWRS